MIFFVLHNQANKPDLFGTIGLIYSTFVCSMWWIVYQLSWVNNKQFWKLEFVKKCVIITWTRVSPSTAWVMLCFTETKRTNMVAHLKTFCLVLQKKMQLLNLYVYVSRAIKTPQNMPTWRPVTPMQPCQKGAYIDNEGHAKSWWILWTSVWIRVRSRQ